MDHLDSSRLENSSSSSDVSEDSGALPTGGNAKVPFDTAEPEVSYPDASADRVAGGTPSVLAPPPLNCQRSTSLLFTPSQTVKFMPSLNQPSENPPGLSTGILKTNVSQSSPKYDRQATAAPSNIVIMEIYLQMLREDKGVYGEALAAYRETVGDSGNNNEEIDSEEEPGKVNRRAPLNPLASPRLGKYRTKAKTPAKKVADPALKNNPLRGRLVMTLTSSAVLFFVFLQALCYNKVYTSNPTELQLLNNGVGSFYAPFRDNALLGPNIEVLWLLGGLNVDRMRNNGELFRLFWAMWMHSGWIHVILNVLLQLQFLFIFEPDWGFRKCFLMFWVSGVTGNLVSAAANPCFTTVGSSGGLFGLLGAMIPYCIEFWNTIPRPGFILVFSCVVAVIALATGFFPLIDNWAHMGGFVGGLCFGLAIISNLGACRKRLARTKVARALTRAFTRRNIEDNMVAVVVGPDGNKKKKVVRDKFSRGVERRMKWECGKREWAVRILTFGLLMGLWALCFSLIYWKFDYQPWGQVTYSGVQRCCCCYDPSLSDFWKCLPCKYRTHPTVLWEDTCALSFAKRKSFNLRPEYKGMSLFEALGWENMGTQSLFAHHLKSKPKIKSPPPVASLADDLPNTDFDEASEKFTLSDVLPFVDILPKHFSNPEVAKEIERVANNPINYSAERNYSEFFQTALTEKEINWIKGQESRFQLRAKFFKDIVKYYV